jgi:hypothetical protein
MARRIFFHVGAPKTGTTFLQNVMWHNRAELARQEVLFPGRSLRDHLHASQVVRDTRRLDGMGEKAASWDRIVDELSAWDGTGVISHEFFGMATQEQAERAFERLRPAETHVVVTARDYARQFAADWQESLKMNLDLALDDFIGRAMQHRLPRPWGWNSHDVPATLRNWSSSLPPDRVHVVTVPPPGAPRDLLWRRWCQLLELDPEAFDLDIAFENQSLGLVQAVLLQRVKPHLTGPLQEGPEKHRWLRAYFAHEVLLSQQGERFGLQPHHFQPLRSASEAAVEAIKSAGYDVVGDLDDLLPTEPAAPQRHPGEVTEDELLDSALEAIEHMIHDVRRLTKERNRLRRKVDDARHSAIGRNLRRWIGKRSSHASHQGVR